MPPQDPPPDLTQLLQPGSTPQTTPSPGGRNSLDPIIAGLAPTTAPKPAGSTGAGTVEVHRRQLLQVAAAMGDDLSNLQRTLTALKVQVGEVGHWDVAQQMGPKVETAHQNMISALDRYCAAYAAAIKRITEAAHNYGKGEQKATEAARGAGRPPTHVTPWQDQ
jgi:hypothetical protein